MSERPPSIDVLEPGYGPLFDAAVRVFDEDERVRALWLSGSLARGEADAVSDLDLILAVRDEDLEAFASAWREWLAAITPTLIARELPFARGNIYCVTPGRERLDVLVESASAVASSPHRQRRVVFDRDGLDAKVPEPDQRPPSAAVVGALVEEFFRDYGMLPVGLVREDWLLALEGIHLIRTLLYRLFVEANSPVPPVGVKQWSRKLTVEQRRVLEALPTAVPNRESVMATQEAVAVEFVRQARAICRDVGCEWPAELEAATCAYLRSYGLAALEGA